MITVSLVSAGCDGDDDSVGDSQLEMGADDSEGQDSEEGQETEGQDSASDTQGEEDPDSECAAETRDDEFAIGLAKSGEMVNAAFVSADPAPPFKGNNAWVIDFSDMDGQPLDNLDIVVIPMMPDHGHGTPVEAVVTATGEPGRYEITPVNLFMTGYWEVNMELTLSGGEQDFLMFGFCVE